MKWIYFLWFIGMCFSCETGKRARDKEFAKWLGKEIVFSNSLKAEVTGRDTSCTDLMGKKFKIFRYVDSTGCCECKLQLRSWNKFIDDHKKYRDSVAFILVVHAENPRIVPILSEQNDIKQPIFMDKNGVMNRINNFSGNIDGWICLLSKDNRILAIGDPVHEPSDMARLHKLLGFDD